MDNELTHYGVLGMKWGVKRGKGSKSIKSVSRTKDTETDKAKVSRGRKNVKRILAISGTLAVSAIIGKALYDVGHKSGRSALQNEITSVRKAAAKKAASTRAANKATKSAARAIDSFMQANGSKYIRSFASSTPM